MWQGKEKRNMFEHPRRKEAGMMYPQGENPAVCLMRHGHTTLLGQFRR